jgi:hypothetical protein
MNLEGKTVTPGLVDAHAHLPFFGLKENGWFLKLQGLYSKEEILERLSQRAKGTSKGAWISAWGVESLSISFMTKEDLDRVTRDHPMLVVFTGGQWGFANSRALDIAGIGAHTPDPPGGKIGRASPGGEPSGLLVHYPALHLVRKHMPTPDKAEAEAALRFAAEMYAAEGVTTVHDNFVSPIHRNFHRAYLHMALSERLPVRVRLWPYMPNLDVAKHVYGSVFGSGPGGDDVHPLMIEMALARREDPDQFSSLWGGFKMAVDGGGPSSMWYLKPGIPLHAKQEFNEMLALFHRQGQQVSVHAVGDQAVDWVLNAVEFAQRKHARSDHRHRIEHSLAPLPSSLDRMQKLGVVVCTHPQWIYGWGDKWSGLKRLDRRGRGVIPLASYGNLGIPLALGADPPAFPIHQPQVALSAAAMRTTRKGYGFDTSERISVGQALRIQTMGGAFAGFQEKEVGSIETGKRADMVAWDQDLLAAPAEGVRDMRPLLTLLGGKRVHGSNTGHMVSRG